MKGKIGYSLHTLLSAMCCFAVLNISAQEWKTDKKVNIVFGLTQPLLVKGFNIEGN